MGGVIELNPVAPGETTFMVCPCKPEGTPFMVVAIAGDRPLVIGLLCPECEQEIPVLNGFVGG